MSKYYLTNEKEKSKNSSIESQMDYFFTSDKYIENVTSKINHENSDAPIPSEENHDHDIIDISGKDPSDVNITTQKDENPSVSPVEPSEPSEPSANLTSNEDESKSVEGTAKSVNGTNGIFHNPHEPAHQNRNSDVSKEIDNDNHLPAYVYRLGHSDRFACKYCKIRDDKWGMTKHYHPEVRSSR
jgi:hypothetical protein